MTEHELPKMDEAEWQRRSTFYSSVGQAISLWASMENKLVEIAALLLGTSEIKSGLMFFSISNFHVWLNTIDELFNLEPALQQFRPVWGTESDTLRQLNDV